MPALNDRIAVEVGLQLSMFENEFDDFHNEEMKFGFRFRDDAFSQDLVDNFMHVIEMEIDHVFANPAGWHREEENFVPGEYPALENHNVVAAWRMEVPRGVVQHPEKFTNVELFQAFAWGKINRILEQELFKAGVKAKARKLQRENKKPKFEV